MREGILEILSETEKITKTASRNNHSLSGGGFYASKFSELHAESILTFNKLNLHLH